MTGIPVRPNLAVPSFLNAERIVGAFPDAPVPEASSVAAMHGSVARLGAWPGSGRTSAGSMAGVTE